MAGPDSTAFLRPDLRESFDEIDIEAMRMGFIGFEVLPLFDTALQTANFSKVPVEAWLEDGDTKRAAGGGYNRGEWEFTQDNYATQEYGAEELIDDRERAIYRYTIDFERVATWRALWRVLLGHEKRTAAAIFNTTTWTPTSVTNEWNTQNATPVDDVIALLERIELACGKEANRMVMSKTVFRNLQTCPQIIDRIKYSGLDDPKQISVKALEALFQVEKILIAGGIRNTANKGQTASLSRIWDDEYVWAGVVDPSPDLRLPRVGLTFHFTGDGSSQGGTIEQYRDEAKRSDVTRARFDLVEKIIYSEAGGLLDNIST